jgi:dihydrofolate reductase
MGGITMRKIVAGLFVSLDGVVESPEKWHLRYFDDEMGEIVDRAAEQADAILLGRRTYQEFAEFWPSQSSEEPFAEYMNATPKHVASTTLTRLDWANSSLVAGDLHEGVSRLKQLPGRDIQVIGSPTLVQWLLREGLLDELGLLVHPIVVGGGKRLFENGGYGTPLRLVDSRHLGTGVVSLTYAPALAARADG